MKRSNRLVILVGVLLAVLAFVAIVILLNSNQTPSGEDVEPTTTTVLVAAQDIGIGDEVTPALVEEREVPLEAVQFGALRDTSQLAGRTALVELPEGTQVTETLFGTAGSGTVDIEGQLLPGEKAIALQFDRVTGLNFLVQQGDVVDIILALDFPEGAVDGASHFRATDTEVVRTVKAVLQAKRVLYVSDTNIPAPPVLDEEGNEVPVENPGVEGNIVIIIAGTDADAELLTFAQRGQPEVGNLTLTLRSADDTAVEETPGVTLADVFETYGLVVPDFVPGLNQETEEVQP